MELADWLLFLHLLGAFVGVSALVTLWGVVFATRQPEPTIAQESASRLGNFAGPMVGIGMTIALVFGIWLALKLDEYDLLDGWIIGALVAWLIGMGTGGKSGKLFVEDPVGHRSPAVRLQAISSLMVVVILILMIWKPGA